jgi:hypothetical protein
MEQNFLTTYTADRSDPFWACAVKGCKIPFPHEVGITEVRKWEHVWADFYYPTPTATTDR